MSPNAGSRQSPDDASSIECGARRPAAATPNGSRSSPRPNWDRPLIEEGLAALFAGSRVASAGRFQLEALIQSCHARRVQGEPVDWHLVATLYGALVAVSPTVGAKVGLAAAHGRAFGPRAGLALLDAMPGELVASYQPFHATRAALLCECGDAGATDAYERALGLTEDPAVRRFLVRRRDATRARVTSAPSS